MTAFRIFRETLAYRESILVGISIFVVLVVITFWQAALNWRRDMDFNHLWAPIRHTAVMACDMLIVLMMLDCLVKPTSVFDIVGTLIWAAAAIWLTFNAHKLHNVVHPGVDITDTGP